VANGQVFAIAWSGNQIPDLETFLGSYFPEFKQALAEQRAKAPLRRGPLHLQSQNLIVESGGHRPDLRGRAFVPALMPPGVTEEEIQ